ncbi:VapC toxin family PIN domain ribonuclease [Limnohabitans sp. T6-5]|uniref:PIN domain-containing protein n=1 Tax=Limnohabitans sp. T6-5 TaxID=1100724 RepID=UPI000D36CEDA|nr:PIN domain-containing protein [Limnohabitans sp. T6-5]PUE08600.1 VapC toxin family PIN domain ribonuclease [Limnohabitans sp. T6-5]
MTITFLDSNVILYLLSADTRKADIAETLLSSMPNISVQVLNEVTSVCLRKLKLSWSEIHDVLNAVKAHCQIVPLTVETHAQAMQIAEQHHLSFYDAHIVAAAKACGANTLMSEDMHNGQTLLGIHIKNPFTHH